MRLEDFDYNLPRERIAQRPLAEREASRMLLLDRGREVWEDRWFRDLPELLSGDELIVVNNVHVLPARLLGQREGIHAEPAGKRGQHEFLYSPIEVLLVRQLEPNVWEALVRPGRKVRTGERIRFGNGELEGEVIGRSDYGLRQLKFTAPAGFERAVEHLGHVPLPPYIKRADEAADRERYQTIFARQGHAAAAPTAGLHFSEAILAKLRERGAELCEITLEVGLGTFEPIRAARVEDHRMHSEAYEISETAASTIARARHDGRPILAVGTTVVRALEDAALKSRADGTKDVPIILPGRADAELFIYPGHRFRIVDQLLTNFHLPKSSLLLMVAAFAGREFILRAYGHAVEQNYRFYSYGDCMLIRGSSQRRGN